jgi:hypothetical protein
VYSSAVGRHFPALGQARLDLGRALLELDQTGGCRGRRVKPSGDASEASKVVIAKADAAISG